MAKKLTAVMVRNAAPGKYHDEHGLFLWVKVSGWRGWVQRIVINRKRVDLGLGPCSLVSLAEARAKAVTNRKLARAGGDPLALRRKPDTPTFRQGLDAVLDVMRPTWKNPKSEPQWRSSLETHAARLMDRRVDSITSGDILAVLVPIWNTRRETARRIKQRISRVMLWAVSQNYRTDDPVAAVSAALPTNGQTRTHQKALPYAEVGAAIAKVRGSQAAVSSKLAFEFLVLTAARSGEVRLATWDEIDLSARTWTVPADRMKAGREHRVPLSDRAVEILTEAAALADSSGLIFPSVTGRAMSDSTLSKLCRELGIKAVPHGMRSSFRDWASEQTNAAHAVMEASLAHTIPNAAEAAYARSDLYAKRRALMTQWSEFIAR